VYQANCKHCFHDVDPDSGGPVDPDEDPSLKSGSGSGKAKMAPNKSENEESSCLEERNVLSVLSGWLEPREKK
jgi:hypothetical protein